MVNPWYSLSSVHLCSSGISDWVPPDEWIIHTRRPKLSETQFLSSQCECIDFFSSAPASAEAQKGLQPCVRGRGMKEQQRRKLQAHCTLVDTSPKELRWKVEIATPPPPRLSANSTPAQKPSLMMTWCHLCCDPLPGQTLTPDPHAQEPFLIISSSSGAHLIRSATRTPKQSLFCLQSQISFVTSVHPGEIITCNIYCNHGSTLASTRSTGLY